MRVLRCRHHTNMWICYWFVIIVFTASVAAIVVWVHHEVNKDSLIGMETSKNCNQCYSQKDDGRVLVVMA